MGLAGPRKRTKIAHDPRNLTWSNAANDSFGHRLMTSQGWSEGQSLGSRETNHHSSSAKDENAARLAAARVGVIFKDDTLGLGAKLKSSDYEGKKTGMDAFVGLLGRLNAKDEKEVEEVERREDQKKLERYAVGRWGGMVFVPGGVLVGGEQFGTKKAAREAEERKRAEAEAEVENGAVDDQGEGGSEKARLKAEKRQRKEARRVRREEKAAKKAAKVARGSKDSSKHSSRAASHDGSDSSSEEEVNEASRSTSCSKKDKSSSRPSTSAPTPLDSEEEEVSSKAKSKSKSKKRKLDSNTTSAPPTPPATPASPAPIITSTTGPRPAALPRTGRALLRGRNIEAKRRAFADAKSLDGIFGRATASTV
jgi:Pin2-interacting protein X1